MSSTEWILTDVEQGIWLDEFSVSGSDGPKLAGAADWSVTKRTLHGGLSEGVDVVEINNGRLTISLLPTRGMGVWNGRCGDVELGWNSPVKQPVHPSFVNQVERGGLGWLTGFNELLCRCGLASHGAPGTDVIINNQGDPVETQLTLHGKIANTPAHHVSVSVSTDEKGTIAVTGIVDETMLFGPCLRLKSTFRTKAGSSSFSIEDEVENLQGTPAELELLYHTNLGQPLLGQGAKLVAPVMEMAPSNDRAAEDVDDYATYLGPTAGYVEQCYFFDLAAAEDGETAVMLRNQQADRGFAIRFNKKQLPWFTVWKNTQAEADGYVTGLEPATSFPNLKSTERDQGRVITLPPGARHAARLDFEIPSSADEVALIEHEIAALQEHVVAQVHRKPHPKFSGS